MLQVYNYNPQGGITVNDTFFSRNTCDLIKDRNKGKDLRKILSEVEKVEFTDDSHIVSKFNGAITDITKISTGCKTLLNIIANPDKVFSVVECGDNVMEIIYGLNNGKIYNPYAEIIINKFKDKKYVCVDRDGAKVVTGLSEMRKWYENQ
ncbi:MAG: DUF4869 domain-containing protein [Lachnospiraceae bacterium]|nr:DUF4869 domain-containing protein [Lachnospiraceae bacterium]